MGDKGADTAVEVERLAAQLLAALVGERDGDAVVEKRELAQTVFQRLKAVCGDSENLGIGNEVNARPGGLRGADLVQFFRCVAARKGDLVDVSVAAHLYVHGGGEGVDNGDAHAVETARDLIPVAAEFAARVQDGEHDLDRRHTALVHVDGDAASIVDDSDAVVPVDGHGYGIAVARERFVDGVVDNLIDKVMQSAFRCRANVHTGTFSYCLESLENLNLTRAVVSVDGGDIRAHLLGGDRNPRQIGRVRHLGGFLHLLWCERADFGLLFLRFGGYFFCHYFLSL